MLVAWKKVGWISLSVGIDHNAGLFQGWLQHGWDGAHSAGDGALWLSNLATSTADPEQNPAVMNILDPVNRLGGLEFHKSLWGTLTYHTEGSHTTPPFICHNGLQLITLRHPYWRSATTGIYFFLSQYEMILTVTDHMWPFFMLTAQGCCWLEVQYSAWLFPLSHLHPAEGAASPDRLSSLIFSQ